MRTAPESDGKPLRRVVTDLMIGFVFFIAFAFGLFGSAATDWRLPHANAGQMARVAAFTGPMATATPTQSVAPAPAILVSARSDKDVVSTPPQKAILTLLAGVFAMLFAFNLAFFRHLRQAYAVPKARQRGKDGWSNRYFGA